MKTIEEELAKQTRYLVSAIRGFTLTLWMWGWLFTMGYLNVMVHVESIIGQLFISVFMFVFWPLFLGLRVGGVNIFVN